MVIAVIIFQAHFSVARAALILGIGLENVVSVSTDSS